MVLHRLAAGNASFVQVVVLTDSLVLVVKHEGTQVSKIKVMHKHFQVAIGSCQGSMHPMHAPRFQAALAVS